MTQELIDLVSNNLETVKRNKIKFEISLLDNYNDNSFSKESLVYELEHMFDRCLTVEDVINEISFKDGNDEDEDNLNNIKSLIEDYN